MTEPTAPAVARGARRARIAGRWALRVLVALAGALIAVLLFGRISAPIGPFDATPRLPAGRRRRAGRRPAAGRARRRRLRRPAAAGHRSCSGSTRSAPRRWPPTPSGWPASSTRSATTCAAPSSGWPGRRPGVAIVGAALTSLVVLRRRREPLIAAGITTVAAASATAGLGAATWRPEALSAADVHRPAGQREQPDRQRRGHRRPLRRLPGLARGPGRQRRQPLLDALRAARARRHRRHRRPAARVGPAPQPGRVRPGAQVVDQFDVDGVLDTGDITDWGSAAGEPADHLGRHARRALRLHPRQPRLRRDRGADRRPAQRHGARRLGDDRRRHRDRRRRRPALHPRQEHRRRRRRRRRARADRARRSPRSPRSCPNRRRSPWSTTRSRPPPLDGVVPLVLAGHTHEREVSELEDGTRLMVEGSTGGAGLRGLQGE